MLRKRFSLVTVLVLVLASLLAGSALNLLSGDALFDQYLKLKEVLSLAERNYVDKIDTQKITEAAIGGMLEQLDPHSVYIPASQMQRVTEEFQGSFEGIGIEFQVLNDTLMVVAPIVGGPSEALGIQAGDRIVRINDTSAIGITQTDVPRKLRGPKGTRVRVTILRYGLSATIEYDITRDKIPLYTVDASFMIGDGVGYISVSRFAATTHQEFLDAARRLREQGLQRLIVDLRGNAGGFLEQSFRVANEFLPPGRKIVYTKGRRSEFNEEYAADGRGRLQDVGVIILVSNGSASASEIVAGCIQDWDRGLVIGETTFGKGLVQRQYMLSDSSAVRLTTARYYTPSGRLIQRPYGSDRAEYQAAAYHRSERDTNNVDHRAEGDTSRPRYRTASGRVVYGGGGITPDYVVIAPRLTEFTVQLRNRQVFLAYADRLLEGRGEKIRQEYGGDVARFIREFDVTPRMVEELVALARSRDVESQDDQVQKDERTIRMFTRAFIARRLWGNEGWSRAILRDDPQFSKALASFAEAEQIAGLAGSSR